jgi:5-methylcytosine-specific restriction endonuclease McrA
MPKAMVQAGEEMTPILPENKKRYPKDWEDIRKKVLARSIEAWDGLLDPSPKCEWCGAVNHQPHPDTGSKVVLTVAHLNHNPADNRMENLAALCQKCHNSYDAPTRQMKKEVKAQVWEAMKVACSWRYGQGKKRVAPDCRLRKQGPTAHWAKKKPSSRCCFSQCPLIKAYRRDYRKEKVKA